MLKKGEKVVWSDEPSQAFKKIKQAIKEDLVLKLPDFSKPMHIFSFSLFHTIVIVLLQKNDEVY